ncbi:MAG TPA: c-type cytochrome [Terriglobales bacterium]|nr:c-type cytochrome [Terriglobales bacterium]
MKRKSLRAALLGIMFALLFALALAGLDAQSGAPSGPKTAEQTYKNIQVLKGQPADQLIPAMQFISNSLGVECDFCHVQGAFEKDDKKPKQVARKMMQMMTAINQENFDNHREVTCNSCHRGAAKPVAVPIISEDDHKPATPEAAPEAAQAASKLPTSDQLIDKYVQALGGAAAIQKVTSRVAQGSANVAGHQMPIDIFEMAPDKRVSFMHVGNGDSVTAYNGHEGWLAAPGRPLRDMSSSDIEAAKLDANLHFATDIKQLFGELHVEHEEKIGDQSAYVISALRKGQPPLKLYFDEQSGLLLRELRLAESPLGLNPTQIDYADYRDVDGVKTPFRWTIARPNGRFTIQLEQVKQNVPIDDAKFVKPAPPEKKP